MTAPVRIPADVDVPDRLVGPLTARQLTILARAGPVLPPGWPVARVLVPGFVFLAAALPIGVAAAALALGQRDGLSLDRLLAAAIRQRLQPRHRVATPDGIRPAPAWLTASVDDADEASPTSLGTVRLPAREVTEAGVVDLGPDGLAMIAAASTTTFALRTPAEQDALVATFGRYLHSLTAPVQVLVRTGRLDLSGQIAQLRQSAGGLPHPALETAALEHADYLEQLAEQTELLHRQVLLVLREPVDRGTTTGDPPLALAVGALLRRPRRTGRAGSAPPGARRAAEARRVRRLGEAADLLAAAGITVTPLDADQATAVLGAACNPDTLVAPSVALASPQDVITLGARGDEHLDEPGDAWADR